MPRSILILADPLETLDPRTDTSLAIADELARRQHRVHWCTPAQLSFAGGGLRADGRALDDLDAVLIRVDPPFDTAYLHATQLLDLLPEEVVVVNDPAGLRAANEKLWTLGFPDLTPETVVSSDRAELERLLAGGPVVVKPLDGCGGRGIVTLRGDEPGVGAVLDLLTEEGARPVLAQRFVDAVKQGDKRIYLLDGEPVGAMLRVPRAGESRANLHCGGTPTLTTVTVTVREREICARVGAHLERVLEQSGCHQFCHRRDRVRGRQIRERGGEVERGPVPQHGRGIGQRGRRSAQACERRPHPPCDGPRGHLRHLIGGRSREGHAVFAQRGRQLPQQERVAARRRPAGARKRRLGGEQDRHLIVAKRSKGNPLTRRVGANVGERVVVSVVARTDDERDLQRLDSSREVREETQGGLVGPVRIVDDQRDRPGLGNVGDEPLQAVQQADGRRGGRGDVVDRRLRMLGGAAQQRPIGADSRLERLTDHPEREVALELGAASVEHRAPVERGAPTHGAQQGGLADPGGTLHEQRKARPALETALDRSELSPASDEEVVSHCARDRNGLADSLSVPRGSKGAPLAGRC